MPTDDPGTFRRELRIEASPDLVFTYFTDPAKMARWMGIEHKLDAVPGGVFHVDVNSRDVAVGEYIEVDPPRRAVFTWGWQDNQHVPPGSTTVEVDLVPDGAGTIVRFAHHGLPGGPSDPHVAGWTHYLDRLEIVGRGGDPGRDAYLDGA